MSTEHLSCIRAIRGPGNTGTGLRGWRALSFKKFPAWWRRQISKHTITPPVGSDETGVNTGFCGEDYGAPGWWEALSNCRCSFASSTSSLILLPTLRYTCRVSFQKTSCSLWYLFSFSVRCGSEMMLSHDLQNPNKVICVMCSLHLGQLFFSSVLMCYLAYQT